MFGACGRRTGFEAVLPTAVFTLVLAIAPLASRAEEGSQGYVGDEACVACHEALAEGFTAHYRKTIHAKVLNAKNALSARMEHGCEACHGPGGEHIAAGGGKGVGFTVDFASTDPTKITEANAACMSCHRGGDHLYWQGSTHASRDVGCTSCHTVMRNVSRRNQLAKPKTTEVCGSCHKLQVARQYRNSHMPVREGKMDCGDCHNPHGTIADSLIAATTINDSCYECHADKRGPFLWEHAPVNENCLNCHDPHGSTRDHMLILSLPRLCQTCHTNSGHPNTPRGPNDRFVRGGSCLQCHTLVHGSNHPSGNTFTR